MPEARLERTRRAYDRADFPQGDRLGDVFGYDTLFEDGTVLHYYGAIAPVHPWRRPSDNAAEQLGRRAHWNVIEGEEHV